MVEPGWVIAIVAVVNLALSVSAIMFTWYSNKQRATRKEIDLLRDRLADVEERRAKSVGELRDRMGRLEAEFPHLPSTSTVHELALRIEEMHGDLKGVTEALKGVKGQLETVNTHLLRESMKL